MGVLPSESAFPGSLSVIKTGNGLNTFFLTSYYIQLKQKPKAETSQSFLLPSESLFPSLP